MNRLIAMMILAGVTCHAVGAGDDDMKPYPAVEPGFDRMVFRVPARGDEQNHKVEIMVGQVLEVDCNRTFSTGRLDRRVAEGWGYPYYVLPKVSGPASTLMACPPGEARREEFVTVNGDGFLQRYNSKLPVVVYVPSGFTVRHRIWSASSEVAEASKE